MDPQKAPIALPKRENHIFNEDIWRIKEESPIVLECHKLDQIRTGSRHHIMIDPKRLKVWKIY